MIENVQMVSEVVVVEEDNDHMYEEVLGESPHGCDY